MALKLKDVIVRGCKDKEKTELEGVLDQWVKLVNQYSLQHSNSSNKELKDACYWHNERANLGVLAAAAWKKKGWCALEEYVTYKYHKINGEKLGRCDLYMRGVTKSYACEAKQVLLNIGNKVKPTKTPFEKLKKYAKIDAKELHSKEADKRLALCFCIPYFHSNLIDDVQNKNSVATKVIRHWLKNLLIELDKHKIVALAYTFPENARLLTSKEKYIFPGVVLLISEIKRGNGNGRK